MTYTDILAKFLELFFGTYSEQIDAWFPNGRNSIKVRLKTKQDLLFTYNDPKDWSLMTVFARHPKRVKA